MAISPASVHLTLDQTGQTTPTSPTDPGKISCEKNRHFISHVLDFYVKNTKNVLEIGAGYGVHAVHFAQRFTQLTWHISDQKKYHALVRETFASLGKPANVTEPLDLDISKDEILPNSFDAIYTSNTLHCMPFEDVRTLFQKVGTALMPAGYLFIYGPFNLQPGLYSAPSNEAFDKKISDPAQGGNPQHRLRDIPTLQELATSQGLQLIKQHEHTTSNNFLLVFQKQTSTI